MRKGGGVASWVRAGEGWATTSDSGIFVAWLRSHNRLDLLMSLLYSSGAANYIGVANVAAAAAWYIDKLGLRKVKVGLDDAGEDCVALGFFKEDYALCLGPPGRPTDEFTPMLNSGSLRKAREFLISRGVNVGEIQQDRQGTHFFEMRDLEGNVIEISEVP